MALRYFLPAVLLVLSGCEEEKIIPTSEISNKYIYRFEKEKKLNKSNFECKIEVYIRDEKDLGEVWDDVFWIVRCESKSAGFGRYYFINKNGFLIFKDDFEVK